MLVAPFEMINRRRRQLHVHSIIYYHFNTTLVTDAVYDGWANQLVALHKQHPEFLHKGYLHMVFQDWTGDTGMHLPVREDVLGLAAWLVRHQQKLTGTLPPEIKTNAWKGEVGYKPI